MLNMQCWAHYISHYILICHAYLILCSPVASFLKSHWLLLKCKVAVWPHIMTLAFCLLSGHSYYVSMHSPKIYSNMGSVPVYQVFG